MARNVIPGSQTEDGDVAVADEQQEEDLRASLQKVIQVNVADAGVLRKTLTVTVPRDHISQELDKEYKQLINEALVPGFRKGRAPRRLVEKRFGGEVGAQVQTRLISNAYLAALEKTELKVLGDPLVWAAGKHKSGDPGEAKEQLLDMPSALQSMKLPEEGDLQFRCEVEVKPEFTLPELDGVQVERPELNISEEDITTQINRMLARRGNWVPVADGKVAEDDMMICDVVITSGTQEIKRAENAQLAARAQRIEGIGFDDFGDKCKGAKVGDKRSFKGDLPDDYPVEDLRGKPVTIDITINDLKRLALPKLDKELLSALGFDGEKEYRDWVRKQMEGQLEDEIRKGMRNQVRRYLLDNTRLDLPEGLSARQTERAVVRKMIELQRQGVPDSEIQKHADELRTIAGEQVVAELKLHFILEEIAAKLEVEVSEEEINTQIAGIARAYNMRFDRVRDDLARNNGIESLYLEIRDEKCCDRILEKARIVKADLSKAEPKAAKPAKAAQKKEEEPAAGGDKPKAVRKTTKKAKDSDD